MRENGEQGQGGTKIHPHVLERQDVESKKFKGETHYTVQNMFSLKY